MILGAGSFQNLQSIQVDDILKSEVLFYLTSAYKMEEPVSSDASDTQLESRRLRFLSPMNANQRRPAVIGSLQRQPLIHLR